MFVSEQNSSNGIGSKGKEMACSFVDSFTSFKPARRLTEVEVVQGILVTQANIMYVA